jgi:hypothetical protein
VELDVNGLYGFAMTQLQIPKGKPKLIELFEDILDNTLKSKLRY